jgi:hypothetical protein
MYLHCDGFKEESSQTDCRTFSDADDDDDGAELSQIGILL